MSQGRLADPDCSLATDPRSDPRMVKVLAQFGMDNLSPALPVTAASPIEERHAFTAVQEEAMSQIFETLANDFEAVDGVTTATTTIRGVDGNDITLFVSRPTEADGPLPCVVHLHGGGMAIGSATDAGYRLIRQYLAGTGLVAGGVDYRNPSGKLGPHPYPAGLNDCASGVRWGAANRGDLGVSHLIVSGESGGGNLTLTLAHKAKREGWLDEVAGFYARCPYISNTWHQPVD